jgi:hypothetical protein
MTIVDMGTSNSRLLITDVAGNIRVSVQGEFGVKDRAKLLKKLKEVTEIG